MNQLAIGFLNGFGLPPLDFVDLTAIWAAATCPSLCRERHWSRSATRPIP